MRVNPFSKENAVSALLVPSIKPGGTACFQRGLPLVQRAHTSSTVRRCWGWLMLAGSR